MKVLLFRLFFFFVSFCGKSVSVANPLAEVKTTAFYRIGKKLFSTAVNPNRKEVVEQEDSIRKIKSPFIGEKGVD